MPVLIVRNERTIADLRPRLAGRTGPAETPDHVVAAIREANPHVDLDQLQPGDVLTIPDLADTRVRDDATPTELLAEGIDAMIAAVGEVVATAGERAAQQAKVEAADRATVRRSVELKAVKEAAKRDKVLAADLAQVQEALAAADDVAAKASATRKQALATWADDLEAIKAMRGQR